MQISVTELLQHKAQLGDTNYPVCGVFFHPGDWRVAYLAIETGGVLSPDQVLIEAARFGAPLPGESTLPLSALSREIEEAPRWYPEDREDGASLLAALPPLVIGPFGTTHAPLMLFAQASGAVEDAQEQERPDELRHLHRASTWLGALVFGTKGELGRLADFQIDWEARKLCALVVSDGTAPSARRHVVPMDKLHLLAEQDDHLVLDLDAKALRALPEHGAPPMGSGNWLEGLRGQRA